MSPKTVSAEMSMLIPVKSVSPVTLRSLQRAVSECARDILEIVVLVDGDDAESPRQLRELSLGTQVEIFFTGRKSRGAAWARNELAALCKGEILFFLDADVDLPPNFIKLALPSLKNLGGLDVWAPQIKPLDSANGPSRFFSRFVLSPKIVEGRVLVPSTALGMRRSAWTALGGFSERFDSAGGEDWEWALRNHLRTPGFTVKYDATVAVRHQNPLSIRQLVERAAKYGRAAPLLEAHFRSDERVRVFPRQSGGFVARFVDDLRSVRELLVLKDPRKSGNSVVHWRGRVLTNWSRSDLLRTVFYLLIISYSYRKERQKELRARWSTPRRHNFQT